MSTYTTRSDSLARQVSTTGHSRTRSIPRFFAEVSAADNLIRAKRVAAKAAFTHRVIVNEVSSGHVLAYAEMENAIRHGDYDQRLNSWERRAQTSAPVFHCQRLITGVWLWMIRENYLACGSMACHNPRPSQVLKGAKTKLKKRQDAPQAVKLERFLMCHFHLSHYGVALVVLYIRQLLSSSQ